MKHVRLGISLRVGFAVSAGVRHGALAIAWLAILASPAAALYIDPISGSLLVQIVAAAVLGGIATVRGWGTRLRSLLRRGGDRQGGDQV